MIKKVFISAFVALAVSLSLPAQVADTNIPQQQISVTVNESSIHIQNANGCTAEIYNLTGVKVMSVRIDASDKVVSVNLPKGYYILKIGKTARRIAIR